MDITSKKLLTFDCYGTLIDWEHGLLTAIRKHPVYLSIDEDIILASFGHHETQVQQESPKMLYPEVLAQTLERMNKDFDISMADGQKVAFGHSIAQWPAFADTNEALRLLRKQFKLVIISNIDNASISASQDQMDFRFDEVFTAQDLGFYKPDTRVFEKVLSALATRGYLKEDILHTAQSLYHDHVPAQTIGLDSVWIDRRHDKQGLGATPAVDEKYFPQLRFTSLLAFAEWCEGELV